MIGSLHEPYDVLVIGGGMSGLSAAYHAASLGATVACAEPTLFGGLVASVGAIGDFPAAGEIAGAALADTYHQRAHALGVGFLSSEITSLEPAQGGVRAQVGSGAVHARTVIIASGARMRSLGLPREAQFSKRGVSDCAWCDGGLYRGKPVAVVGGGDSALQAALHLVKYCERVSIIVRGLSLRARRRYLQLAADLPQIEFLWETIVEDFEGDDHVEGIRLRNLADNSSTVLRCDCVFVYAGLEPASRLAGAAVKLDDDGFIATDGHLETSMRGIFAAGAVRSGFGGSIANALAEGEVAAAWAVRSLDAPAQ